MSTLVAPMYGTVVGREIVVLNSKALKVKFNQYSEPKVYINSMKKLFVLIYHFSIDEQKH